MTETFQAATEVQTLQPYATPAAALFFSFFFIHLHQDIPQRRGVMSYESLQQQLLKPLPTTGQLDLVFFFKSSLGCFQLLIKTENFIEDKGSFRL